MNEKQERLRNTLIKARNFVLGFLGWYLFINIVFFGLVLTTDFLPVVLIPHPDYHVFNRLNLLFWVLIFVWLPTILVTVGLFVKEKTWVGIGIITAVIVNTGLIVSSFSSLDTINWQFLLFPYPAILILLAFSF